MTKAGVPESVDELVTQYDRLIGWEILRATGRRLREEEIADLRQEVYLRIIEKDFLGRCRTYYADHTGRFSTSLVRLVRNCTLNHLRRLSRTPTALTVDPPEGEAPLLELAYCDQHEAALIARDVLAYMGALLDGPRQHVPVSAVLAAAVEVGLGSVDLATATGMKPGTVRYYLHHVRALARTLHA